MQGQEKAAAIIALTLAFVLSPERALAVDSFQAAIQKQRQAGVDQVSPVNKGLPYFSPKTLNPTWEGAAGADKVAIPPIRLRNQEGAVVTESLFQGRTTFVAFIFTSCSGFCPFLLSNLKKVAQTYPDPNLQFVAISVDPEIDTPERLKSYQKRLKLDSRWTLLTGEEPMLRKLIKETFVSQAFQRKNTEERNFAHSEHFYVIDKNGYLRAVLNGTRLDTTETSGTVIAKLERKDRLSTTP